jgi:hypothetical protein
VARIPDEASRHDAEDILDRLRSVMATEFDESGRDESGRAELD